MLDPPSAAQLAQAEDEIDAFVCAYTALFFWTHGEDRCRVVGDVEGGYIVTPVGPKQAVCLDLLASERAIEDEAAPPSVGNGQRTLDLLAASEAFGGDRVSAVPETPQTPSSYVTKGVAMATVEAHPQLRGLETVRVRKDDLLERIERNRDDHRAIFEEALAGWKQAVTEALEDAYRDALAGKEFRLAVNLYKPEDHTDEYDTIIEMLRMSQDDELELSQYDFACYALDKWDWQANFLESSSTYVQGDPAARLIEEKLGRS